MYVSVCMRGGRGGEREVGREGGGRAGNAAGLEVKKKKKKVVHFSPPEQNTDLQRGYTTHEINQAAAQRLLRGASHSYQRVLGVDKHSQRASRQRSRGSPGGAGGNNSCCSK